MTSLQFGVRLSPVLLFLVVSSGFFPRESLAEAELPAAVLTLLPAGTTLADSNWDAFETEFGITFGGDLIAEDFPGKKPSCAFGPTPEFKISLQGDTAFEQPPMLEMALQQFQMDIDSSFAGMSEFVTAYVKPAPDVVSVGSVQKEKLGKGDIVYVEMVENCTNHANGAKTMIRGYINRGATRVSFNRVASGDGASAKAVAAEIFRKFEELDIAVLSQ